jgi:hypothetical protein
VAERLREVAQQLTTDRCDLLRQQSDVIDERGGAFEHGAGPVESAGGRQGLRQPERAEQEGALVALEAVPCPVAVDQPALVREAFLGGVDR